MGFLIAVFCMVIIRFLFVIAHLSCCYCTKKGGTIRMIVPPYIVLTQISNDRFGIIFVNIETTDISHRLGI